ncbi:MAG: hypothetical protein R3C26_06700 [Calditrichia bacterium]
MTGLWFARFSHFMMAALAMTGAAILFFFFNWVGGKKDMTAEYSDYVRKFGGGIALGMSVCQLFFCSGILLHFRLWRNRMAFLSASG